jgi:hypothetical protein
MSEKTTDALTQRVLELLHDSDDVRLSMIRRLYEGEITPVQLNTDAIPGHREAMLDLIKARQKVDTLLETHPDMEIAFEAYRNALYAGRKHPGVVRAVRQRLLACRQAVY